jgi:hypothetical protein
MEGEVRNYPFRCV